MKSLAKDVASKGLSLGMLKQRGAGGIDPLLSSPLPCICKSESSHLARKFAEHFHFCIMWTLNQSLEERIKESLRVNLSYFPSKPSCPFFPRCLSDHTSLLCLLPSLARLGPSCEGLPWGWQSWPESSWIQGLLIIAVAQKTENQLS